eukprot:1703363-Ditylum_brightwellii.AAC.1
MATHWQLYFCKGVDRATAQAIMNTKLLTSYFRRRTSTAHANLPQGYNTIHDGWDNDRPVNSTQRTMQQ